MQGCKPGDLGDGTTLAWTIPDDISSRSDIDVVRVYRSSQIDKGYEQLADITVGPEGTPTSYHDANGGNRNYFYLVSFVSTATPYESCFHVTYFPPLPSEVKLIEQIRRATPKIIQDTMTDEDYLNGLNLALGIFNCYPPQTAFTLQSFPRECLYFLIGLGQLTTLTSRYLPLSIRDWRYSEPGGVVMDVDRGAKVQAALEIIGNTYTQYLPLVKLDYAHDFPIGVGTVQLPLSMGGIVSRGLLNILDIFTATGR